LRDSKAFMAFLNNVDVSKPLWRAEPRVKSFSPVLLSLLAAFFLECLLLDLLGLALDLLVPCVPYMFSLVDLVPKAQLIPRFL
jgi:hypothetical protein